MPDVLQRLFRFRWASKNEFPNTPHTLNLMLAEPVRWTIKRHTTLSKSNLSTPLPACVRRGNDADDRAYADAA